MNIAFLHEWFPAGGAERVTMDIAGHLSTYPDKKYNCYVYCAHRSSDRIGVELEKILNIKEIYNTRNVLIRFVKTYRAIREDRIDVFVQTSQCIRWARLLKKLTGVSIVVANHGEAFWMKKDIIERQKKKHQHQWKLFRKKACQVQDKAMEQAVKKIRYWYDSSDVLTVLCEEYRLQTESALGIRHDRSHIRAIENSEKIVENVNYDKEKIVLFSGHIRPEKRIDRLIRIWAKAGKEMPGWRFIVMGDPCGNEGNLQKMVKDSGAENIEFTGNVNDTERYYRKASVVCLTSESEGWGLCLTEGQAHGCIPVAYRCSAGVEEVIGNDRRCGFCIEPDDEDAYVRTLIGISQMSGDRLLEMRKACVKKRAAYIPEIQCEKWRLLFEDLRTDGIPD